VQSCVYNIVVIMPDALMEALAAHMANDDLIKGWEATRRICIGRDRGPLRKASRDVNTIRETVLTGKASEAAKRKYLNCIESLHIELSKAQEQDFDGMLREALGWLEARETGALDVRLPTPACLTESQKEALERIRDYRFTNSPGHVGVAVDRDLRLATKIAKELRVELAAISTAVEEEDLAAATANYVDAADRFSKELRRAGEPDFDGLLRQAVLVLDSAPTVGERRIRQNQPQGQTEKDTIHDSGNGMNRRWKEGGKQGQRDDESYSSTYYGGTKNGYSHDRSQWATSWDANWSSGWNGAEENASRRRRWHAKKAPSDQDWWGA